MDRQVLRLELLKIAHNHGLTAEATVKRVEELEQYVVEEVKPPRKKPGPKPKHQTGSP
jgi:hypothetical protein